MKSEMIKRVVMMSVLSLVGLAGCHSYKKENVQPPTPLVDDFQPTVQVTRLWKTSIGDGASISGVRMRPAVADGVLYAASNDGRLLALDALTGKKLWSTKSDLGKSGWFGFGGDESPVVKSYAGGPAVSGELLVVGSLDGHVYGVNAKDGSQLWDATVSAAVLAAPVISNGLVLVRTEDGNVFGLDAATGTERWVYDQSTVPLLSLRGNGPLLVANGVVFLGSDDGKLIALREDNGNKLWEQRLGSGEGRTDIERLNDADGSIILDGTTLYGSAYHGNLTAIDGPSGRPLWNHAFSSYVSLAVSGNRLFGVNADSEVWAFDKNGGTDLWKNASLKYRWLSAPAVQGDYVVVGDMEGYLHWLQTGDGALAAREDLSGDPIRAQPLVVGDVVYVEDVAGHIAAYRVNH